MSPSNKNYAGIGLTGLAIIVFWIFGMPAWDRVSLLNDAVAEREHILSSRTNILERIDSLNKQYQERASDIDKISSVVPDTKETAELVSTIETITQQTGLQLIEITMSESTDQQQEIQTLFIELGLKGGYSSLTSFLELLEKNVRLMDAVEISASDSSVPGEQIILNLRVKISTYYLNVE